MIKGETKQNKKPCLEQSVMNVYLILISPWMVHHWFRFEFLYQESVECRKTCLRNMEWYKNPSLHSFPSVRNLSHMLPEIKRKALFPLSLGCPSGTKSIICQVTMVSRESLSFYCTSSESIIPCIEPPSDVGGKNGTGLILGDRIYLQCAQKGRQISKQTGRNSQTKFS